MERRGVVACAIWGGVGSRWEEGGWVLLWAGATIACTIVPLTHLLVASSLAGLVVVDPSVRTSTYYLSTMACTHPPTHPSTHYFVPIQPTSLPARATCQPASHACYTSSSTRVVSAQTQAMPPTPHRPANLFPLRPHALLP